MRTDSRGRLRLGCTGGIVLGLGIVLAMYGILAPWSFHIGGRWTPAAWWGVGRLRDSTGAQYGLYVYFFPDFHRGGISRLGSSPWPRFSLRGKGQVCTAGGAKYRFDLSGQISGAWLTTDGSEMDFSLREKPGPRIRRAFSLHGAWHGQELALDDRKTMFIHFRPGGELTPAGGYTSPVPEKHATVTLAWGSENDFESLCASLAGGAGR